MRVHSADPTGPIKTIGYVKFTPLIIIYPQAHVPDLIPYNISIGKCTSNYPRVVSSKEAA